LYNKDNS